MKKVVVLNHALVIPVFRRRWELLAKNSNLEVHLIIPEYWEQEYFSEKVIYRNKDENSGNFRLHCLPTSSVNNPGTFVYLNLEKKLQEIRPDLFFMIGNEGIKMFQQLIGIRESLFGYSKLLFFTMNAKGPPYKRAKSPVTYLRLYRNWKRIVRRTDAAVVHYPGCLEALREAGYLKPIYLQTQVGVDGELFSPDNAKRMEIREKLALGNSFVIGFLGRLIEKKGIFDIARACISLHKKGENVKFLCIGNGTNKEDLVKMFEKEGLQNLLLITDFVQQDEVPDYLNSIDTLALGSHTTADWIDTFPLATVQAQAVGIPVIASNSGSIPWQLEKTALIFPERNSEKISEFIERLIKNPQLKDDLSVNGRKRSLKYFCIEGMTENFIKIINQTLSNSHPFHGNEDDYTQWKAY